MTVKPQAYGEASAASLTRNLQRTVKARASGKDLTTVIANGKGLAISQKIRSRIS